MQHIDKLKGAIYGLAIGDAIGVPYEFQSRGTFNCTDMIGYGTHKQSKGAWSDDTSMTLALMDSINRCNGRIDVKDIRKAFKDWMNNADYTPFGAVFDIGGTTELALTIGFGINNPEANGNGSLMRTIPLAFIDDITDKEIADVSAITHAHSISKNACIQYVRIAQNLLNGIEVNEAIDKGMGFKLRIKDYTEDNIFSDGYVISTLWAALWAVATTNSYEECILKAINLGNDTDTVGAVAGGLAGIIYGYEAIPQKWIDGLQAKDIIDKYMLIDYDREKEDIDKQY